MINYPISFFAKANAASGMSIPWEIESPQMKSLCAVPTEFEGPGGAFSPEDLFALALINCFIATFKVYAEKSHLAFEHVAAEAELIVDHNEARKTVMKSCLLRVTISGCENPDRIKLIAHKALSSGFILNSVKTELSLDLTVEPAPIA